MGWLESCIDRWVGKLKTKLLDPNRISVYEKDLYFNREYARPKRDQENETQERKT